MVVHISQIYLHLASKLKLRTKKAKTQTAKNIKAKKIVHVRS